MTTTTAKQKAILTALNQEAAAWMMGLTTRQLRDTDAPRGSGGAYNASELWEWDRLKKEVDDLGAGDSPAMERYRAAKAMLAELDLHERQRVLVCQAKLNPVLGRWANHLRTVAFRLQQRFGTDAGSMMKDALAECDRIMKHELGGDDVSPGRPTEDSIAGIAHLDSGAVQGSATAASDDTSSPP